MSKEKAIADDEEKKVQVINEEVTKKQHDCMRDLAKAEPALKAAQEALDTLNKVSLKVMTTFVSRSGPGLDFYQSKPQISDVPHDRCDDTATRSQCGHRSADIIAQ